MFNYSQFATKMLSVINRDKIAPALEFLDKLTVLKYEKQRLFSSLGVEELDQFLCLINKESGELNNLVVEFHQLGKIKNIDRLNSAYRRLLHQNSTSVLEIEYASEPIDKKSIEKALGQNAIYIYKLNPNLIAGLTIKSSMGEFEYNLNQHLIDLKAALVA